MEPPYTGLLHSPVTAMPPPLTNVILTLLSDLLVVLLERAVVVERLVICESR